MLKSKETVFTEAEMWGAGVHMPPMFLQHRLNTFQQPVATQILPNSITSNDK